MISGDADGDQTGTVEEINFVDANPRWKIVGSILQPLATTKAVLLPMARCSSARELTALLTAM